MISKTILLRCTSPQNDVYIFLGIHLRQIETCHTQKEHLHNNVHWSFIHSSQSWKQLKCPSVGLMVKQIWDLHEMEY